MIRILVGCISLFGICRAQNIDVSVKSEMIYGELEAPTAGMVIPDLEYFDWVEGKLPFLFSISFYAKIDDGCFIQLIREEKEGEYYYVAKFNLNKTEKIPAYSVSQRILNSDARRLIPPETAQLLYEYFSAVCLSSRYGVRVEPEFPLIYVSTYSHPTGVIAGYTSGINQKGRAEGLPKVIEALVAFIDDRSISESDLRELLKGSRNTSGL